jgi:hypothetical protein
VGGVGAGSENNSSSVLTIQTTANSTAEVSRVTITSASTKNVRFEEQADVRVTEIDNTDTLSEEYYTLNYTNNNLVASRTSNLTSKNYYKNKSMPMKELSLFGNIDFEDYSTNARVDSASQHNFTAANNRTNMFYAPTPVLSRYNRSSARIAQALRTNRKNVQL